MAVVESEATTTERPEQLATHEDAAHFQDADEGEIEICREAHDRLEESYIAHDDERQLYGEDVKFLDGEGQWSDRAKRARGTDRPMLTINKLPSFTDQAIGEYRQNKIAIRVVATDAAGDAKMTTRAGRQLTRAEAYTAYIRNIEQQHGGEDAIDTTFETVLAGGFGYWRLLTQYVDDDVFEQDIWFERILDPLAVYFDPNAKRADFSDINYCFIVDWMPRKEYERRYPGKPLPGELDAHTWQHFHRWYDRQNDRVQLADYYRRVPTTKTIVQLSDGRVAEKAEIEPVLDELAAEGISIAKERQVRSHKVQWFKIGGLRVIDGPIEIPCRWIPVFKASGKELAVDGVVKRRGMVRHAKDAQRAYNYWRTATTETVALQPKMPYIAARQQVESNRADWEDTSSNKRVLTYDHIPDVPAPQRQQPPEISTGMVQETITADNDLTSTVGSFRPTTSETRDQRLSGVALERLNQRSNVNVYPFIDNMTRPMAHCGRCLVDMVPRVLDTQRVIRLLHEDQSEEFLELFAEVHDKETGEMVRINDLRAGKYGVTVKVGPSHATARLEGTALLIDYLSIDSEAAPIIRDLVVGNMDHPTAAIAARRLRQTVPEQVLEGERGDEDEPRPPSAQQRIDAVKAEAELAEAEAKVTKAKADETKSRVDLFVAMKEAGLNSQAIQVLIEQEVADMIDEREGAPGQTTPPDTVPQTDIEPQ